MKSLLIPVLCVSILTACGSGNKNQSPTAAAESVQQEVTSSSFSLANSVAVATVSEDSALVNASDKVFVLPKGTDLTVLETRYDETHGELMHLGIDSDSESMPSDIWVKASAELKESLTQNILPSELEEIQEEGFVNAARRKMTYCYRFVKQHLLKTGKVRVYLPGVSAWMAYRELPKHGFRLTGHSPANAANGEVCLYKGGRQGHGHIEIKINGKWWYGYGYLNQPMRGRIFMGCFAK